MGFEIGGQEGKALLDSIGALYNEAEQAIKQFELEFQKNESGSADRSGGVLVPAVNELRYAGQHMVQAFTNTEGKETECLQKAEKHACRAVYDAYDAIVLFYLLRCQEFDASYKDIIIPSVIPDYVKHRQKLAAIKNEIPTTSRADKCGYLSKKREHLQAIREIFQVCDAARPELNKALIKARKESRNNLILIFLSLLAIVVAVVLHFVDK